MKKYIALKLSIPEEHQDTFIAMISDFEITGIEQSFDELTINFPANYYNDTISNELSDLFRNLNIDIKELSTETIVERNWNEEWEKKLEPVIIDNRLVIAPRNKSDNFSEFKYVIKIDPQMSFGTGYHATTRLASKLILDTNIENQNWLDAGTGTGILAILLSKMGASTVNAFDIDEWSVKNSIENVQINSVKNITVSQSDLNTLQLGQYNGIVANIFANILIDNMSKFADSLTSDGIFICTGVLKYDKMKVYNSAIDNSFDLIEELSEDEWIAYKFRKI
ncbi:50S ribosomal protein L11 methyltransferase [bacterium]|nr:MAG: 50S ribosomal protein L11 methyltransferase [bacterium]